MATIPIHLLLKLHMKAPRGMPVGILNTNHILPCSHCVAASLLLLAIYHLIVPTSQIPPGTTLTLPLIVVIAPTLLLTFKDQ